jgi:hypothetical protein
MLKQLAQQTGWKEIFFGTMCYSFLLGKSPDEIIQAMEQTESEDANGNVVYCLAGLCFDLLNNECVDEFYGLIEACRRRFPEFGWDTIGVIRATADQMVRSGADQAAVDRGIAGTVKLFFSVTV